jgi:predicted DNA-binding transcriptional regulator YafY
MFGRSNYLVAAEIGSEAPRTWRLDRIEDLEVLDVQAAVPDGFDLDSYATRSFGVYQEDPVNVVLRVTPVRAPEAMKWRFHRTQTIEPQQDGSVIVRFRAGGILELVWHLFTWGDTIEILDPAELRHTMVRELNSALEWHSRKLTSPDGV